MLPSVGRTVRRRAVAAAGRRALLLAAERPEGAPPLRIALAAPTGKAAVRMAEAMAERIDELASPELRQRLLALQPQTLHRLLGLRPDGTARHGLENPLPVDVVVVDEASMVDLVLMRQLLEALPSRARLVLLGDPDQLASVEAGSVLADLVRAGRIARPDAQIARATARFTRSHRFETAPGVAALAEALQAGDEVSLVRARELLCGRTHAERDPLPGRLAHLGVPEQGRPGKLLEQLAAPYLAERVPGTGKEPQAGYAWMLGEILAAEGRASPRLREDAARHELLRALDLYRVLATHRRGPLGVAGLLRELEAFPQPDQEVEQFWDLPPVVHVVAEGHQEVVVPMLLVEPLEQPLEQVQVAVQVRYRDQGSVPSGEASLRLLVAHALLST